MDFGHTRTTKTNPLAADCERVAVVWTWMSLQSGSRSLTLTSFRRIVCFHAVSTHRFPMDFSHTQTTDAAGVSTERVAGRLACGVSPSRRTPSIS